MLWKTMSQDRENGREEPRHDVTLLLVQWRGGDDRALDRLGERRTECPPK
jgi:hypothetical protein